MYHVSYTSERLGISVGALGKTFAEAVAALAEEFGEDVVDAYAETRGELRELVEEARAARLASTSVGATTAPSGNGDGEDPTAVRGGSDRAAGSQPDRADPVPDQGDVRTAVADADQDPPVRDRQTPPVDVTRCVVCGDQISDEMAKASKIMAGEHRCAECMA